MRPISVAGVLSVTGTGRPKEGVNRVIMVSQKRRKTVMGRVTAKTIVKLGGVEYINFFFLFTFGAPHVSYFTPERMKVGFDVVKEKNLP